MITEHDDSLDAPRERATYQRIVVLSLLTLGYLLALAWFFRPVQAAIQNEISGPNLFAMTCLVAPFLVTPIVARLDRRLTRYAWILSAIMALDVVFFAGAQFGILGGHPALGSVLSVFLGMAKCVLIPTVFVLLALACLKGERVFIIALGFLCLAGETLYTYYPRWW